MDAQIALIPDMFNYSTLMEIPFFQRGYVWDEDLWGRFLEESETFGSLTPACTARTRPVWQFARLLLSQSALTGLWFWIEISVLPAVYAKKPARMTRLRSARSTAKQPSAIFALNSWMPV